MRTAILASTVVVAVVAGLAPAPPVAACTTAVISGSATRTDDRCCGRTATPTTSTTRSSTATTASSRTSAWSTSATPPASRSGPGSTPKVFAIMNSASYNLDDVDTVAEGAFMKVALQSCRTVADFQALLEATNEAGRSTTANFGVIDAHGGAAYFETGVHEFKRFDATDPAVAPQGWIVRTNYSEGGDARLGSGLIRFERARSLVGGLAAAGRLTAATLLAEVARRHRQRADRPVPRPARRRRVGVHRRQHQPRPHRLHGAVRRRQAG